MSEDIDTKKLDQLIKAFAGEKQPTINVGVLGQLNIRNDESNNASIGLKHEFGQDGLPIRSFLRMPITEMMQKYIDKSGAFDKEAFKQVVADKTILPWIKKIGFIAETIVADAFQTGGFGQWKASNMKRKKNHQTLVETAQLRTSITSEVAE